MPTFTAPSRTLNVRIPETLAGQLEVLTKTVGRNKSAIAVEALTRFVETETWQVQRIREALEEADAGEFATDDEVSAFFAEYGC